VRGLASDWPVTNLDGRQPPSVGVCKKLHAQCNPFLLDGIAT
jgi:hypothetical protein